VVRRNFKWKLFSEKKTTFLKLNSVFDQNSFSFRPTFFGRFVQTAINESRGTNFDWKLFFSVKIGRISFGHSSETFRDFRETIVCRVVKSVFCMPGGTSEWKHFIRKKMISSNDFWTLGNIFPGTDQKPSARLSKLHSLYSLYPEEHLF